MSLKATCDICGKVIEEEPDFNKDYCDLEIIKYGDDEESLVFEDLCNKCMGAIITAIETTIEAAKTKPKKSAPVVHEQVDEPEPPKKQTKPRQARKPKEQKAESVEKPNEPEANVDNDEPTKRQPKSYAEAVVAQFTV